MTASSQRASAPTDDPSVLQSIAATLRRPEFLIPFLTAALYITTTSYLRAYLEYVGARAEWFSASLVTMLVFAWPAIRNATFATVSLLALGVCSHRSWRLFLGLLLIWYYQLYHFIILDTASTLPGQTHQWTSQVVFTIGCAAAPWIWRVQALRSTPDFKKVDQFLAREVERQTSPLYVPDSHTPEDLEAKDILSRWRRESRNSARRLWTYAGLVGLGWVYLSFAERTARYHAWNDVMSATTSSQLGLGHPVLLFTDGTNSLRLNNDRSGRFVEFVGASHPTPLRLPVFGALAALERAYIADMQEAIKRVTGKRRLTMNLEEALTVRVLVLVRLDVVRYFRKHARFPAKLSEAIQDSTHGIDGWNQPLYFTHDGFRLDSLKVGSPGPDGFPGNLDDLTEGPWPTDAGPTTWP